MPRTSVNDLRSLVNSYHSLIVIESVEEERACAVLAVLATDLRRSLFEWSITKGLSRWPRGASMVNTQEPLTVLSQLESLEPGTLFHLKDFHHHIGNHTVARALREVISSFVETGSTVFLSGEGVELPPELEPAAVRVRIDLPNETEIREVVQSVLSSLRSRQQIQVNLKGDETLRLLRALSGLTRNQARQLVVRAVIEDGKLDASDIDSIIARKGELVEQLGLLEYYPVEGNGFELGGFARLKEWLERAQTGFSLPAREINLAAPRGVLLVGVQGCGKSLAAKYIARKWQLPLLKLDAGRLFDKYVGESEKNFRKAVRIAEAMAPVVLWIDEIEKAFAQGGSGDADGGLSRRLFGSFLTWMQEKKDGVFVVGAANDLSAMPPELLRKGRFDEIFFVDLPDEEERETIFAIHLRLRKQTPETFRLPELSAATDGFSGAEIEQAVIASLYRALHKQTALTTELLLEEIHSTVPLSISKSEEIQELREMARHRFVPVR